MTPPTSFHQPSPATLGALAVAARAELRDASRAGQRVAALASLRDAGPHHLTFFDGTQAAADLATTRAGACLVSGSDAARLPPHVVAMRTDTPLASFVAVASALYGDPLRPRSVLGTATIAPSAVIDRSARLEDGVVVDPLAVIGPNVEIGSDTVIGAGSIIGAGVRIGRGCEIGPSATAQFALIGNHVIVGPGCRLGHAGVDGTDAPHLGRVLIQHRVRIGAGAAVSRGQWGDTVIGEGTSVGDQTQVGPDATIGRHGRLGAQAWLGANAKLGDAVTIGGAARIGAGVAIGEGATIVTMALVAQDVAGMDGGHGR